MASSDSETKQEGKRLDDVLRLLSRPFKEDKIEALDTMLQDVELTLAGFAKTKMPGTQNEVREYRAVRDALFEAKKQTESLGQPTANSKIKPNQGSGAQTANGNQDSTHEARISVGDAYSQRETELQSQIPDDEIELSKFGKRFEDLDPSKTDLFKAYTAKVVKKLASQVPDGVRYPDTVASVFGNGKRGDTAFLYEVVSNKLNRRLDPADFMRLRFSEVAGLIGINVNEIVPDYSSRFNTSRGLGL
jgi:hypothetical protein